MKKLFVMVALVLVMSMLMTSCGSSNQGGEDPAKPDTEEKVLRIGGMGPLTGDYANYGLSVRNGAQVAVDEINAGKTAAISKATNRRTTYQKKNTDRLSSDGCPACWLMLITAFR